MNRHNRSPWLFIAFISFICVVFGILLFIPGAKDVRASQVDQGNISTPTSTSVPFTSDTVDLYAFVSAPDGEVTSPYILFTAYGDVPDGIPIGIKGSISGLANFQCDTTPCKLPITSDTVVDFYAFTNTGSTSQGYTSEVRVYFSSNGNATVTIKTTPTQALFSDSCSTIWGVSSSPLPDWGGSPDSPTKLNTNQTLYYLANSLIKNGVVDVSDCPSGGITDGSPNGCAIETSRSAMIEWQNKFDLDVWLAGNSTGIPPILLKTFILQESQFWPGNAKYVMAEFGLAQINDFGADVALRWDPNLYLEMCKGILSDCSIPYWRLSEPLREMVRGNLLNKLNAECPTCQYGLDMNVARSSVYTIARVIHANCWESGNIVNLNNANVKSYEDFWKFTLVSYHSGYSCLDNSIKVTIKSHQPVDWQHISQNMYCPGAVEYVDNFWNSLTSFNSHLIPSDEIKPSPASITYLATKTPPPPPGPSKVSMKVTVYVDKNGNNNPETTEGVSGVIVQITLPDGTSQDGTTDTYGNVRFSVTGVSPGDIIKVTLENLYRTQNIVVPPSGDITVDFKFAQPDIPSILP
jgi:hypothetical protein